MDSATADDDLEETDEEEDNPQDGEKSKSGVKKSAEALERAERLQANFIRYEHLSDEELQKILPRKADGTASSIGAMLHSSETCSACSFFHYSMKGCHVGIRCKYCHAEHPKKEKKRARRKKRAGGDGKEEHRQKSARTDHDRITQPSEFVMYDPAFPGVRLNRNGNSCPSWLKDEDVLPSFSYARPTISHAGAYGPYGTLPHGASGAGYTYCMPGQGAPQLQGHPYGTSQQHAWCNVWGPPSSNGHPPIEPPRAARPMY